jgi:hypothetical protein
MTAAARPVQDDELVEYKLTSLHEEFDSPVSWCNTLFVTKIDKAKMIG